VKKLLIIQQDDSYFLFETFQVLEKNQTILKDYDVTILVEEISMRKAVQNFHPIVSGVITDSSLLDGKHFDISVNLSLDEASWRLHGAILSDQKIGPYTVDGQTFVNDNWSSFLMTLKAKTPFLTFHLQDIYKNILGFKSVPNLKQKPGSIKQIAFGTCATHLFTADQQEKLLQQIAHTFPYLTLQDISEIDLISDLSQIMYIGPATVDALKFCEAGGRGIFLSSGFQGFNLLPYGTGNLFVSSRGTKFETNLLLPVIENQLKSKSLPDTKYSLYVTDHENIFGAYLKSLNQSDDTYPIYQSHVVLWNFLLNLFDTNLDVSKCTHSQLELLKLNHEVLRKVLRLHDYAMVSADKIFHESKAKIVNAQIISGHVDNLIEIERLNDQIAATHPMIRPILDFYRIRRGQNTGNTLSEQSQHSYLTYSEEHQALTALDELFSVTLRQNEVNI
jgi:hypothetical protein